MLGLVSKRKYDILKREFQELEQTRIHWKKMHDIEFIKRMNTIKESANKDCKIEELEKIIKEETK
ncbi:hypothetical protein [Enterococcus phage vB_EfaP_Ef6.2]|uniref:Uncharacterized protein n=1 Tax=Enterococcus phage vB_EfaP_Ef6.2 TaxID=2546621 RepID=A0A4D6DSQ9_9CAUD|nr:hypothetical protein H3T65_gp06 [Enterococcus phage vB_EfaP_Ef6.2]QBZ69178.1 hypothetical protein [Enterococcus phage vB_EfaP_Ef6.2]